MINRHQIEKDAERDLVLYRYLSIGRVIASEYSGKICLVLDALRTGRRDGATVCFAIPIRRGSNGTAELQSGLEMARQTATLLPRFLPD